MLFRPRDFLLCVLLFIDTSTCVQCPVDKECQGDECNELKRECQFGECMENGYCECNKCFSGVSCSHYEDKHRPKFELKDETVYISALHKGLIYVVDAIDLDRDETCEGILEEACLCADFKYTIIDDEKNKDYFKIDQKTGHIFLVEGQKLEAGSKLFIKIAVSGNPSPIEILESVDPDDTFDLNIIVEHADGQNSSQMFLTNPHSVDVENRFQTHRRAKRDATAPSGGLTSTNMTLELLSTPVTELKPGMTMEFKLTIAFPVIEVGSEIDLNIEVFVHDALDATRPTTLHICDFHIEKVGSGLQKATGALKPEDGFVTKNSNVNFPDVNIIDSVTVSFGSIHNTDTYSSPTADFTDSSIVANITVVMIQNSAFTKTEATLVAGAEYADGSYIWIADAKNTLGTPPSTFQKFVNVLPATPTPVPEKHVVVFEIEATILIPFKALNFKANIQDPTSAKQDLYSIVDLGIDIVGKKLACLLTPTDDEITYTKSVTGRTNHKATRLYFHLISGLAEAGYPGDPTATGTQDEYKVIFSATIELFDAAVGDNVGIEMSIYDDAAALIVSEVKTFDVSALVTLTPLTTIPNMQAVALDDRNSTPKVAENQGATFDVELHLTRTAKLSQKYSITCSSASVASHVVCGVKWGKSGRYIGHLPPEDTVVTYNPSDGTANWAFTVTTAQLGSDQTYDAKNDILRMEVTIQYQTETPVNVTIDCNGKTATLAAVGGGTPPVSHLYGNSTSLAADQTWYVGSTIGVRHDITLPSKGIGYKALVIEATGDETVTAYEAKICEVRIGKTGRGNPCFVSPKHAALNDNATFSDLDGIAPSVYARDGYKYNMGPACSAYRKLSSGSSPSDYRSQILVFYELPLGQSGTISGDYKASAGLTLDSAHLWVNTLIFTTSDATPVTATSDYNNNIFVFGPTTTDLSPFNVVRFHAYLKTKPGSVGDYSITVLSDDVTLIEICRVEILNVGASYACIDKDPYGKEANTDQRQTIILNTDNPKLGATVHLGVIRNHGDPERVLDTYLVADEDTIEIAIAARGLVASAASITTTLIVNTAAATPLVTSITFSGALTQNDPGLTWNVTGENGTGNARAGVMKIVEVHVIFPPTYSGLTSLELTTPSAEELTVCYAAVKKAGKNLPCLFPQDSVGVLDAVDPLKMVLNLSEICTYPVTTGIADDNVLTISIGVQLVKETAASSLGLTLIYPGNTGDVKSFALTLDSSQFPEQNVTSDQFSMGLLENETVINVTPGERKWLGFWVSLPHFKTFKGEVTAMSYGADGRAYSTVHDWRWGPDVGQGANIGCLQNSTYYHKELMQNATTSDGVPMYHISQTTLETVNLNYITNTGITTMSNTDKPEDNRLHFQAEFLIAEHDMLANTNTFNVSFAIKLGTLILVVSRELTLLKPGAPNTCSIEGELIHINDTTTPFNQYEQIGFSARLWHTNVSHIEIYAAVVRIFMPSYLYLVNDTEAAASTFILTNDTFVSTITPTNAKFQGYLDFNIDYLFFTDVVEINFTLTVDPLDTMVKGLNTLDSTLVMRLVGKEHSSTDPLQYITCLTPYPAYVNYNVEGSECKDDLLIGAFQDCQFSASNAMDSTVGPAFSKTTTGWSPAVRDIATWTPYITIDFRRKVRVTQIKFTAISGKRQVGTFKLQSSMYGTLYQDVCPGHAPLTATYGSQVYMPSECRIKAARYARLIILTGGGTAGLPLGVQFDWYGCHVEETETADSTCEAPITVYSDQVKNWRHAAYDLTNDFFYFCDYNPTAMIMFCHSSQDGLTWNKLPGYIQNLAGYDATTMKMYAYDSGTVMLSSVDGITWDSVDTTEKTAIASRLVAPTPIPGKDSSMPPVAIAGTSSWTGTFTGIEKDSVAKIEWDSRCT